MRKSTLRNKEKYEGQKFTCKFGEFEIVEYHNNHNVVVKFTATGYVKTTFLSSVQKGTVKDLYYPYVYGVGFYGEGNYKSQINGKHTKVYKCWNRMMERCYSSSWLSKPKNKNYIGCEVHPDWHNFQTFGKWYDEHYIEGYGLDKDIKVKGNKIYGADTCLFVSKEDNTQEASAKTYELISPEGIKGVIYNMSKFCEDKSNCVEDSSMFKLVHGRIKRYKGWTLPEEEK